MLKEMECLGVLRRHQPVIRVEHRDDGADVRGVEARQLHLADSLSHDGVHRDVEDGGGERAALGDTVFSAKGAVVISGGAADEDGLVPKGADEVERLGPNSRVLKNLKAPPPIHGAERLAEIRKDAVEGHLLTGGELLVQRHNSSCDSQLLSAIYED